MQGAILQQAVKVELQHSCMAEPPPKNESWKGNEAQKERIQDYVTPFLEALPEGGKLSLSKDFISTVLEKCYFTESARNGVRSYIRDHLLKAEYTSSHATRAIDLVAATETCRKRAGARARGAGTLCNKNVPGGPEPREALRGQPRADLR